VKLGDWLRQQGVTRLDFARRCGLSPAAVTGLCNNPEPWLSRETAAAVARVTGGAVTPNDFLGTELLGLASGQEMPVTHASITEAIEAFARGEIVIVTDDDDRENEGDLVVAASHCTPEKMAFIIRNTCASTRWWPRTTRRSAPPSRSRSTSSTG
jgi:3,4-dihydroxy 2-butanone 4-phosphate synthase / GTP cyclohydrolase II